MSRLRWFAAVLVAALCGLAWAQSPKGKADPPGPAQRAPHLQVTVPEALQWNPIRDGYEMAVVYGDPSKQTPFVIRIRCVKPGIVPPHWHPSDEFVTVLAGSLRLGMGEKFNESALVEYKQGAFLMAPKRMPHFASAKKGSVIQVHGMGPFQVNYVDPKDAPAPPPAKK